MNKIDRLCMEFKMAGFLGVDIQCILVILGRVGFYPDEQKEEIRKEAKRIIGKIKEGKGVYVRGEEGNFIEIV